MKLEKFMFCMTLQTSGLVMGLIGVFFHVFILMWLVIVTIFMLPYLSSDDLREQKYFKKIFDVYTIPIIFTCTVMSAFIYINILLLKGIQNNQHRKMRPWLVVHGICIVVSVLGVISLVVFAHTTASAYVAGCIAGIAFYIYCFMAVHSLFENIRDKSQSDIVRNILTVGFLQPTTNHIPEETQTQMNFNYVKLV